MLEALSVFTVLVAIVVAYLFLQSRQQAKTLHEISVETGRLRADITDLHRNEVIARQSVVPTAPDLVAEPRKRKRSRKSD